MLHQIAEYVPYDRPENHLRERETLEKYAALRAEYPDALVIIKDLECGHYQVKMYKTEAAKQKYIAARAASYIKSIVDKMLKTRALP